MTPLHALPAGSSPGPLSPLGDEPPGLMAPAPEQREPPSGIAAAEASAVSEALKADCSDESFGSATAGEGALPAEVAAGVSRPRRRARRRELHCPLHPEQKLFSVSAKHHLYVTDVGQLMLRGLSKRRADELLAAYRRVLPLTDEWIEAFWCDACACTSWWHVQRHDRLDYSLSKVPRELWEQATGVIRVEGNPTVSQFSRRQARAGGVHGMRQYRFL